MGDFSLDLPRTEEIKKEVEKELKISYPTVRSRLDDIIQKLLCACSRSIYR